MSSLNSNRNNAVEHPAHYNQYSVEVIDIVRHMNFCLGNVIKYVLRAPYKGKPTEDCDKALFYLGWVREDKKPVQYGRDLKTKVETIINESDNPFVQRFLQAMDEYMLTPEDSGTLESVERRVLELKDSLLVAERKAV